MKQWRLLPHLSKSVDNDSGDDRSDNQVDEEDVDEVERFEYEGDGAGELIIEDGRYREAVVHVNSEAGKQSGAVHLVIESILAFVAAEVVEDSVPVYNYHIKN